MPRRNRRTHRHGRETDRARHTRKGMGDRIDVLIEDMIERQARLLRLREPGRRKTAAERRLDDIVQGDRKDRRWARKHYRRVQRAKARKLGKLGAAGPVRRIDPATGEVIEEAKAREDVIQRVKHS
jgi:hypothetical protein